jgi:hypothetical protein
MAAVYVVPVDTSFSSRSNRSNSGQRDSFLRAQEFMKQCNDNEEEKIHKKKHLENK